MTNTITHRAWENEVSAWRARHKPLPNVGPMFVLHDGQPLELTDEYRRLKATGVDEEAAAEAAGVTGRWIEFDEVEDDRKRARHCIGNRGGGAGGWS